MEQVKIGDIVTCMDASHCNLSVLKAYVITKVTNTYFYMYNDRGNLGKYVKERFKLFYSAHITKEQKTSINNKILSLEERYGINKGDS